MYYKSTTSEVWIFLSFSFLFFFLFNLLLVILELFWLLFLNFCSFLLNGKGVERRTNVLMVCFVVNYFCVGLHKMQILSSTFYSSVSSIRIRDLRCQQMWLQCWNMAQTFSKPWASSGVWHEHFFCLNILILFAWACWQTNYWKRSLHHSGCLHEYGVITWNFQATRLCPVWWCCTRFRYAWG